MVETLAGEIVVATYTRVGVLILIDALDCWSGTVTDGIELDTGRNEAVDSPSVVGMLNETELVGMDTPIARVEPVDHIRYMC